jgi:predicted dehydrogenase
VSLRFGIVGSGMMGQEHIRNIALVEGAEVTALADPYAPMLDAAGALVPDAARFDTAEALAASGLCDAVVVASPNHTHRAVLGPLFDAGLHILCEKPLAHTPEDARAIAAMADASGRVFWTGMEYRFMPPARRFIERVHAGEAGRPVMLAMREHRFPFLHKVAAWNRWASQTGGTMVEKCCHFFDLMRHILRDEPVSVFCSGSQDVNHLDERYGDHVPDILDNSFTVVDFRGGARAMLDLSMFADGAEHQEEFSVTGEKARLDVAVPPGEITLSPRMGFVWPKAPSREQVAVDQAVLDAGHHHGATYFQHLAFRAAVAGRGPVEVTAQDGWRAVAMGAAAERSAKERRVVPMAEFGL